MRFCELELAGAFTVEIDPRRDERGFFARTFDREEFLRHGLPGDFVQSSIAWNARAGTIRGLHLQLPPFGEVKLVRCTRGAVHDVVVDLRPESPTFRRTATVVLDAASRRALVVPQRFAHGYQVLEDDTEVAYSMDAVYVADAQRGIRYDDPELAIAWPLPPAQISERDLSLPTLAQADDLLARLEHEEVRR